MLLQRRFRFPLLQSVPQFTTKRPLAHVSYKNVTMSSDDNKSQVTIPKAEDVAKYWNAFSGIYSAYLERVTLQSARSLYHNLKLDTATSLLEVGCGPGNCAREIITLKLLPEEATFTVTDYSTEMVKLASTIATSSKVEVFQADSMDLNSMQDASFDRYLANLSLHIVPDPDKMLAEAYRVLKSDGIAAFSVWGRKENSPQFTVFSTAVQNLGLSLPVNNVRSQFHLGGSLEELRQMVLKAGFKHAVCWHQQLLFESFDVNFIIRFVFEIATGNRKILEDNFSPQEQEAIKKEAARIIEARRDSGQPFGFEAAMVLATK
jgi:ubiquinone/menaquinone biosynthesis C-methylase UbiE